MKPELIYATYSDVSAMVILNGVNIYHEDDDRGAHTDYCGASTVAIRIGVACDCHINLVVIPPRQIDDWTFEDLADEAINIVRQRREQP